MLNVETVVYAILFLIGLALIWGLLLYAVNYCQGELGGNAIFYKAARIFLVLAAVFILIGWILQLMGHPIVRW